MTWTQRRVLVLLGAWVVVTVGAVLVTGGL